MTEIEIETVAEVRSVSREAVKVRIYPPTDDEPMGTIMISQSRWGGDYQYISFPADKAAQIANAILEVRVK